MKKKILDIPLKMMIRECSLNPNLSFENFNYFALKNRDNIHDIFKYKKFNNDFVSIITVYADDNNFADKFMPSYEFFINQLIEILNANVPVNMEDNEKLTEILLKRLEILADIKNEKQLKESFPLLYRDLVDGRRYFNSLQYLKNNNSDKYYDGEHYYYSCALKKSLKNFIPTQVKMYKRYILDRNQLKDKYTQTSFNSYIKRNFDMNKLAMFIAHEYLCECEVSNNRSEIVYYLEKIDKYLKNNKLNKNVKIYTDSGVEINLNVIYKRINEIKKRINNDSMLNWILIPKDRSYKTVKKDKKTSVKVTIMNYEKLEKLHKLGTEKNNYYESTNYKAKVIGLGKYKGYIGYIYENGEVVLDTEYNEEKPYTAAGNAIYIMYANNFEELSKKSKTELQNDSRVKRLCHTKNWQDKLDIITKREATENDKYNSSLLIKRLKRKALY